MMRIYIHSSGRADRQLTWNYLPPTWRAAHVRMVVQHAERNAYRAFEPLIVLPKHITQLSPTRQWILENSETKRFVMMDDDLEFARRRTDNPTLFKKLEHCEYPSMFSELEALLDDFIHAGFCAREGANRIGLDGERHSTATRMMRVLAYRKAEVLTTGARFDRVPTKQDFDMTLQLLRAGFPNAVLLQYTQGQRGSNAHGGCSAYRTEEMMVASAKRLARLHPGLVRVVQKQTKSAWGGAQRTDVTIAWKKALAEAGEP